MSSNPARWRPVHLFHRGTAMHDRSPIIKPPSLMQRLTTSPTGLLINPYLGPSDAARLMRQNQFLRGLVTSLLAGWVVIYVIAFATHGIPPPLKEGFASAWAAVIDARPTPP